MNFYDYYQAGEDLGTSPVYLAAQELIENGLHVIPLKKGGKEPANIKSVFFLLANPLHLKSFDFYFKDRDVDIGIILDNITEFIDIDEKNLPGITQKVLHAIQSGWPELYEKLVLDFTPSGGCHIIYRSEVTGGKVSLAKVKAQPNPVTTIERISRHNKQYIKISPSQGYELRQGNPLTIPMLTAEERNFISAVCASFNQVHAPEVKKKEAEREDSPWAVFNSTHDWKYIRNELIDRSWQVYREEADKVYMRRPGNTQQKYSGVIFKESNVLYLFTPSTEFENERPYSPFGVYALLSHEGNAGAACKQLASEGCGKNIYDEGTYWYKEGKRIKIRYTELLRWYHSIGYRKHMEDIVQVIDNVVHLSSEENMKIAFINEVEHEIVDDMFERVNTMFNEGGGLMSMLSKMDDNFISDTKDHTWIFFKNIAIKISNDGYEPVEYKTLTGYIWSSEIIPRDFYGAEYEGCDADRFINILGGERSETLQKIIGYLISRYKDPLNPKAVILMEDIDPENEGESQGGSGKGLCVQFVKQFRKTCDFDGKNFHFSNQFLFQNVSPDTALMCIDDVDKGFKFTQMFSIITGALYINRKNKEQVIIPYEKSPKIVFTSNYSVGSMDASSRRRKYEFPVVKYFGEDKEPIDEFGRQFFDGWDAAEWRRFDNLIVTCCQKYLAEPNRKSLGVSTERSAERSLIANTSRDFVEYMDNQHSINFFDFAPNIIKTGTLKVGHGVQTNAVNMEALGPHIDDPDYYFVMSKAAFLEKCIKMTNYRHLSPMRVTQWLKAWGQARSVEIDTSYKRSSDGERMYRIVDWFPTLGDDKGGNGDQQRWEQPPF